MEIESIIIGVIILAICIVQLMLMSRNRKKTERKKVELLLSLAKNNHSTITKHEACGDYIIGIDEQAQKIFFVKQGENLVEEQCINLREIKQCVIERNAKTVAQSTSTTNLIEKLQLTFIPSDKTKKEIALEFFNAAKTMQLFGELQSIEKWHKEINTVLNSRK